MDKKTTDSVAKPGINLQRLRRTSIVKSKSSNTTDEPRNDLYSLALLTMHRLGIESVDIKGKRVLIRVDFNVPIKNGAVLISHRIAMSLPTIRYALEKEARAVILMSHLGNPEGRPDPAASMKPVVAELQSLLGRKVTFLEDCVGAKVELFCANPPIGSVILLENLRFHLAEEGKGKDAKGEKAVADPTVVKNFRESLSKLGDVFINDAFGKAHLDHSSMVGLTIPIKAGGFLMRKELKYFSKALEHPMRPLLVILGGQTLTDKVQLIENLLDKVDEMIIAGEMAFTFVKTLHNIEIGNSFYDDEGARYVNKLCDKAKAKGVKLLLPSDFITGDKFAEDAKTGTATVAQGGIPAGWMGLDVGYKTNEDFTAVIEKCKTIVWNGPPGVYQFQNFSTGTKQMMDAVVRATQGGAISVLGGKDTTNCAKKFNTTEKVTHVSTGGVVTLELLEGKILPAVSALDVGP